MPENPSTLKFPSEITDFVRDNETSFDIRWRSCESVRDILNKSGLPYLTIEGIEVPYKAMLKEALRLEDLAIPHRTAYEGHRGWKSLVLHGLSSIHTQGAEKYGLDPEDPSIYKWTDISDFCPVTTEFFKQQFHYDHFQRVRFMFLEPGGYIQPHQDTDKFFIGPTNIALNNPIGCRFLMENVGVVPFKPGQINKLALVNRHIVINESAETRVHVIVHGAPNPDFWNPLFQQSYRRWMDEFPTGVLGN